MLIDVAAHILPPRHRAAVVDAAADGFFLQKRIRGVPELWDLDARFRAMDEFSDEDYRQVLTLANPPIERVVARDAAAKACRLLNEEMRELVDAHPDRFVGAFGCLPLTSPDGAVAELDRVEALGLVGVEVFTDVDGVPLDDASVLPILEEVFSRGLAVFMHPLREITAADYSNESVSRFEAWQILGWPYATSVAMMRLALSGLFERHPDATLITHHAGGMIPFFASRIEHGLRQLGSRTDGAEYEGLVESLPRPPVEYLRRFSCDTALSGGPRAIGLAADFFGSERVFFGSDMPFDSRGGRSYIADALRAVRECGMTTEHEQAVLSGNAISRLRLPVSDPA
ncbi:amidohydrolase family protein [Microbacterium sp. STN6]|uniref:amidohydrolase family protein n=1 Tax=Microbacterium sp. STN6 TaxID=2995588 RepID=UPI002260DED4|nr:amidohydrolase family protein [Microbacterium sp. STN6]MCX7522816.1 amidohydrolase family protein [Microbacterium sp. STN6]